MEKSRIEIEKENRSRFVIITKIKSKIKLTYNSKLKSNVIGRDNRRKTHNLTQSLTQNDPINHQIQGFSVHDFENKVQHSRDDFFLFYLPIIDFKHSSDAEMSLEEQEIK